MIHTSYISIGSNLEDRIKNCETAVQKIKNNPEIIITKQTSWVETKPIGYTDQHDFINGIIEIKTSLDPETLLHTLLSIETEMGRKRLIKWGPRSIDLDILLYDDAKMNLPHLKIPHPEIKNREFIKRLLKEIRAE